MPMAGVDYPINWNEFIEWFSNEDDCLTYLEKIRWKDGFICPSCGEKKEPYRLTRNRLKCTRCYTETTATSGTIFHRTRTPLRTWFSAAWYITNQKYGTNALGLQRILGFGSYQTAWMMLHKFRRAMIRPGRKRLAGNIEMDESYIGGKEEDAIGRGAEKKSIIAIAVEMKDRKAVGRIRLQRISDATEESLKPFVVEMIEPGSIVKTDGWPSYNFIGELGYIHKKSIISKSNEKAHVLLPGVHLVSSLLKRWIIGTLQGSVSPQQLDYYLDEFTFRFNRRTSRSRGLLFYRLIEQSVLTGPHPYDVVVGGGKNR